MKCWARYSLIFLLGTAMGSGCLAQSAAAQPASSSSGHTSDRASDQGAAQALAFYRTPAGQHTLSVMPALMQEIAQASQKAGERVAQEVFDRPHQEIEDAIKKLHSNDAAPDAPVAPSGAGGQGK